MEIHQLDATSLLEKLNSKELSSVEIVRALLDRADQVDGRIRSLVYRFDEAALEQAQRADDARGSQTELGPLHGLPITIKESIATEGDELTLGVKARKGMRAPTDAVVVKLLKEAGAIVIGKTNVSQLLLFHESANPLFGATNNPWSDAHVPGGSSGGEAAAIAAGITPLGVGTDIGGSIRVPAVFTGTAGLKPTVDRWSNLGCTTALMGQEVVRGQIGPMARSARDVALLFRAIDSPAHTRFDSMVAPLETEDPSKIKLDGLKIGFFVDDGFIRASSSIARAVETSAKIMESYGAKVIPFTPRHQVELMDVYFGALSSDGGATVRKHLAGGEMADQLKPVARVAGMNRSARNVLAQVARLAGQKRVAKLLQTVGEKPVEEYWRLTGKRSQIRKKVFDHWQEEELDIVLCPAFTTPAIRHGQADDFSTAGSYSMRYNFLNFPGGAVGVSKVMDTDSTRADTAQRLEKKAADVEEHSHGLPVGIQVVGRPYQESKVLAVMMAIEARVRENSDFPNTPVP